MYKILIVDDYEIFCKRIAAFDFWQKEENFQIAYQATNGAEALNIARNNKVDVIIADIKMPIMNGLNLIAAAREEKLSTCNILMSEYCDFEYAQKGLIYGAFDYLVKPVEEHDLIDVLNRVLEHLNEINNNKYSHICEILLKYILEQGEDPNLIDDYFWLVYEKEESKNIQALVAIAEIYSCVKKGVIEEHGWVDKFICRVSFIERLKSKEPSIYYIKETFNESIKEMCDLIRTLIIHTEDINVMNTQNYILNNIEGKINLNIVAENIYLNKTYLSHIFRSNTGYSFIEYSNLVKIEYAKRLLRRSDIKVAELAVKLGFQDANYFVGLFKTYTKVTPNEYRRQIL